MKKLNLPILTVALALVAGTFVCAQAPDEDAPPMHRHGRPNLTEMLNHTLQLTDAQKAQVKPLADAAEPKLKAIHEQARAQADEVLQQLHTQIRPLLDAEQQKKLDALETLRASDPHGPAPE
jgi:Spy/CpxP family protein refolding chaperone